MVLAALNSPSVRSCRHTSGPGVEGGTRALSLTSRRKAGCEQACMHTTGTMLYRNSLTVILLTVGSGSVFPGDGKAPFIPSWRRHRFTGRNPGTVARLRVKDGRAFGLREKGGDRGAGYRP